MGCGQKIGVEQNWNKRQIFALFFRHNKIFSTGTNLEFQVWNLDLRGGTKVLFRNLGVEQRWNKRGGEQIFGWNQNEFQGVEQTFGVEQNEFQGGQE